MEKQLLLTDTLKILRPVDSPTATSYYLQISYVID